MFRITATILLLAAFSAQTFQQAAWVLDYYTNTASFAARCENKALPKMHCNGKCQLMKKLQQEQKKDQERSERKENTSGPFFSQSFSPLQHAALEPAPLLHFSHLHCLPSTGFTSAVFHPPLA